MSLDPTLLLNSGKDIIEGFQDNGEDTRKPLIADKVMAFMARGICQKWKQPISYYFNEGGMKTDLLTKTIKEVVKACQEVGLKVRSIICDQGTPNIAAIGRLYQKPRNFSFAKVKKTDCLGYLSEE